MILELLPVGRGRGRLAGTWRLLPFAGLAVSVGAAMFLLAIGHRPGGVPPNLRGDSLVPILAGFGIYYLASIGLAFALNDQRAFCKYLCPSSVILRRTSRLSLAKMASRSERCNECGACSRVCPMDIDVAEYAARGRRVTSGECILCQRCAHACPTNALHLSLGFDVGGRTYFVRPSS
jgi:polyferredoxin